MLTTQKHRSLFSNSGFSKHPEKMAGEITDALNMNDSGEKELEKEENEQAEQNGSTTDKLVKLPISRIRRIIKTDPDVSLASQEAMVVLTKATELFVQHLSREAVVYTFQGKRKTIQRKDLDCAVDRTDSLAFLDGALE